ncbi:hydroxyacylglutathione hydrolase [bacterium endosymbiont of Pedicinus badii]|uniref:hydroxyacylglutathione hydrolase n=1 Tax=bacterium endosymbiont of Pedicinus badii TaxID=1719126 RepID=UPI0009B9F33C|nr:hydroxyacylglutathione hydrolase [bacterium endosymbiont of Pedicinus badii]OQM34275.1 hypothetical protein AOQ89_00020 [bacterium endosymbiont of Pedicinus badii]
MKIIQIPCFSDNYIWIVQNKHEYLIIDPGESKKIIKFLENQKIKKISIFLTHHHIDHTEGVHGILKFFPKTTVFGPKEIFLKNIDIITKKYSINIFQKSCKILQIPGHTKYHVGYYLKPWLFCGDTLFSGGCGRVFETNMKTMYSSLNKIKELPEETIIFPSHEYTLNNIFFSKSLFPKNKVYQKFYEKVKNLRKNQISTLPTNLKIEKKINIFFHCAKNIMKKKFSTNDELEIFSIIRKMKDNF